MFDLNQINNNSYNKSNNKTCWLSKLEHLCFKNNLITVSHVKKSLTTGYCAFKFTAVCHLS